MLTALQWFCRCRSHGTFGKAFTHPVQLASLGSLAAYFTLPHQRQLLVSVDLFEYWTQTHDVFSMNHP